MPDARLDALGTLFEALLPAHLDAHMRGYIVLHDVNANADVALEVREGHVKRVAQRDPSFATLLSLSGTLDALRKTFAGGFSQAVERHEIEVTGDLAFARRLGGAR